MQVRTPDSGAHRAGWDGAPRRVSRLRVVLLAREVEGGLGRLEVEARRAQQSDARSLKSLLKWRPNGRVLARKRPLAFVQRTKAARQEPVAVDDQGAAPTNVPTTTGITLPPTSIRVGTSPSVPYSNRMWMMLRRPIFVPCSLV